MEASQLKVSPETLRFKPMTRSEKLKLRRENVKALIKSKPAGTIITMPEFAVVTATSAMNVNSMIATMVKKGEILKIQSEDHGQRYSWVVNEKTATPVSTKKTRLRYDIVSLQQMAKTWAWDNNSDSLRDFIKSLEGEQNNVPIPTDD